MTGPGDWVIPSQNVSAPPFLGPNDPGIILGPEVPPCMASTYSAVWRFQPDGAATGGLDAPPSLYFGQLLNSSPAGNEGVDVGYLIYDADTICGFVVTERYEGQNRETGDGTVWAIHQFGGFKGSSTLPATFRNEFNFGDTSGAIGAFLQIVQVNINKGDPLVRQPNPRNTPFTIDSVTQGRGLMAVAHQTANINFGAETALLVLASKTYFDTRAYQIDFYNPHVCTLNGFFLGFVRRGNGIAGTLIWEFEQPNVGGGAANCPFASMIFTRTGGSDVTQQLTFSGLATAGVGTTIPNGPFGPGWFRVTDIGAAADYPNAPGI